MCGRFVGFRNLEQLRTHFPIDVEKCDAVINYNVAPSQEILALAQVEGLNVLDLYHWGLVPHWAKDTRIGYKMINARSETVATKSSFKQAFKKRRCLILVDGFYEWYGPKGNKQPLFITLPDKIPFAFAGLWELWHDPHKENAPYRSCTIITRPAHGEMQKIHHRMPVILPWQAYTPWLDTTHTDTQTLDTLLTTQAVTDLVFHPVDKQVNAVRHNDPSNIKPIQMEFDFSALDT